MSGSTAVLVPHFNNPEGLYRTLHSVAAEGGVHVYVLDDGSTIAPLRERIEEIATTTTPIEIRFRNENLGITATLNELAEWIRALGYLFIARIDAGDVSIKNRFRLQQEFLMQNPRYVLVGGQVRAVDAHGNYLFRISHPHEDTDIRERLLVANPFVHPAVMIRADSFFSVGKYPVDYPALEDWALFIELARIGRVANLQCDVVEYVISDSSISSTNRRQQSRSKVVLLWDNKEFSKAWMFGMVRSIILVSLSRSMTTFFKRILWK